jgi:hypothetical protein
MNTATDTMIKHIAIKFLGGTNRSTETLAIVPGNTAADILAQLGLQGSFILAPHDDPEHPFKPTDNVYARVEDGALLVASAMVDAGV